MKKNLFITLLVLIHSLSFTQIQWHDNGIPVRQGENIKWSQNSVFCADETFVSVWSDTRAGVRGIYAQKYDANGNKMWLEEGLLVSDETSQQNDPVVTESGNGDVIIAWIEYTNEWSTDVYAQKISSEGILQWAAEGVPLCTAEEIQNSLNIVPDDNGGTYVIWLDNRNIGLDIYGTHIDENGNIVTGWAADGNPIVNADDNQRQHTFLKDGYNGAVVAWQDNRNPDDINIYMQRIASNGDLLWDENGNLLAGSVGLQEMPKITPDGTGNFIFSWRDMGVDSFGDIKAQRVDLNGNLLWVNEVEVYVGDGIQRNARITKASDNGAIIVWEDGRNEIAENYKDIYAQKLDTSGSLQWAAAGVEVVQALNDQLNPRLSGDANGGAWITWEDGRVNNHPHEDIYIQHVNSSGTFELAANGFDICSADGWQFSPLVKISENKVFCVWGDNRTGSTGIYVQLLDNSGNIILEEDGEVMFTGLSGLVYDHKILANQDQPILLWVDNRNATNAQIYLQMLNSDGSYMFTENGIPITTTSYEDQNDFKAVFSDNSETIAVVWLESRLGYGQVYAQCIDTSGNYLWSDSTGFQLCVTAHEQNSPKISIKDNFGNEEYYVGWEDYTDFMDGRIQGQKIIDGNLEWGAEGKTIVDRDGNDVLCDVYNNYYIWQSVGYNNKNIFCLMVDENGNPAPGWDVDGLEVCIDDGTQEEARIIEVPEGILIVWDDTRNGDLDVYGQIVTPEGTTLWVDGGIPLIDAVNDQHFAKMLYDDAIYMVWKDFRSGMDYDIYIQKFDIDGNEIWQEDGVPITETVDIGYGSLDLIKVDSKFIVVWDEADESDDSFIKAQLVNENGELQWQQQGVTICDEIFEHREPRIVTNGENEAYIAWIDGRSGVEDEKRKCGPSPIYGLYAQKIQLEPTSADDELVEPIEILSNYPNPFNPETTIYFETTNLHELAQMEIYNIKGQKIRTIDCHTEPVEVGNGLNSYTVIWNGTDQNNQPVASGIYFYQLNIDDKVIASKKCILLK